MENRQNNIVLTATDIHKKFGDQEVLKGINMVAHSHDVVSIIGSSGSGKSTFLRCLNLLETPDQGRLKIYDQEVVFNGQKSVQHSKQLIDIRKQVSMVFQSFNLWNHMSILDNVIIAPMKVLGISKKEAIDRAELYLNKVGIYHKRDAYPAMLSGGQQQRCAIARALAMEPQILLFDEPTSALDPELVGEVLKIIQLLAEEGRTMVLVTHEIAFAREISSQVMFIHQGLVEERGTSEQVFGNPQSARCQQFLHSVL
ncbi:ABC transporter ATP-binding protein [Utexia brackfieldae]|uniref:ABC transporter ATP-binding protein n=1 Tax=Utexia brackfieldae TaxID=3074108 RepID=UPI00370D0EF3